MALTANTNPNPNLVELTRILERHTSIWFSDPVLFDPSVDTEVKKRTSGQVSGECVVCYNNLLSGESSLSSLKDVRKLAGRPLFYRLNYIRQLSTTHLAVDLDGTHNRLSHCLGTLDIASRFVSAIQKQISLDDIEVKAVLVYAFIHDCFHGPMGHSLDLVKDVLWGPRSEEHTSELQSLRH